MPDKVSWLEVVSLHSLFEKELAVLLSQLHGELTPYPPHPYRKTKVD